LLRSRSAITAQDRVLQSLSYKNVLKRGFAVVRDEHDRPVTRVAGLTAGCVLSLEWADGRVAAVTGEAGEGMPSAAPVPGKKRVSKPDQVTSASRQAAQPDEAPAPKQGSLF
jgi:exodeoxyribonuclease VII large subunit